MGAVSTGCSLGEVVMGVAKSNTHAVGLSIEELDPASRDLYHALGPTGHAANRKLKTQNFKII